MKEKDKRDFFFKGTRKYKKELVRNKEYNNWKEKHTIRNEKQTQWKRTMYRWSGRQKNGNHPIRLAKKKKTFKKWEQFNRSQK